MRAIPFLALLLLLSTPALAHQYELGSLEIHHPWTRATPPGAKAAAGYLEIENQGDADDRLVAVRTPLATNAELHDMTIDNGIMEMRPLPDGLVIPAHGAVTLAPGGIHVMFRGLQAPLVEDEMLPATLVFEKAGEIEVQFMIKAIGAEDGGHDHEAE